MKKIMRIEKKHQEPMLFFLISGMGGMGLTRLNSLDLQEAHLGSSLNAHTQFQVFISIWRKILQRNKLKKMRKNYQKRHSFEAVEGGRGKR